MNLDEFVAQYIETALWSSIIGEDFAAQWNAKHGEDFAGDCTMADFGFDVDDLAPDAVESIRADCEAFVVFCGALLDGLDALFCGHDFWLTRNRYAGYWDGYCPDHIGDALTAAARMFGSSDLFIGNDERIYAS